MAAKRYYLYISDSKVDMLLSQIDPALTRKSMSELSLNLKIFGAKRGVESPAGADRIARLERVVRHLEDYGDLGSVDEPGQFFRGMLPMRWGPFYQTSLVYFGGHTKHTVVGLGDRASMCSAHQRSRSIKPWPARSCRHCSTGSPPTRKSGNCSMRTSRTTTRCGRSALPTRVSAAQHRTWSSLPSGAVADRRCDRPR